MLSNHGLFSGRALILFFLLLLLLWLCKNFRAWAVSRIANFTGFYPFIYPPHYFLLYLFFFLFCLFLVAFIMLSFLDTSCFLFGSHVQTGSVFLSYVFNYSAKLLFMRRDILVLLLMFSSLDSLYPLLRSQFQQQMCVQFWLFPRSPNYT